MTKIKIKGDTWKIYVFDDEEYVSKFGEGTSGFTDTKRKQMFFNAEDLDLELVRHELAHGYLSYQYINASPSISDLDREEIYCEMFAKDGPKMLKQAEEMFNKLRGME